MKRAQGGIITPRMAQGDKTVDQFDDVNTGQQVVDKILGDSSGHTQLSINGAAVPGTEISLRRPVFLTGVRSRAVV